MRLLSKSHSGIGGSLLQAKQLLLIIVVLAFANACDAIICFHCYSVVRSPNDMCVYAKDRGAETRTCLGTDNACAKIYVSLSGYRGNVSGEVMARYCTNVPPGQFDKCVKLDGRKVSLLTNFPVDSLKEMATGINASNVHPDQVTVLSGAICRCKQDRCNDQPKHDLGEDYEMTTAITTTASTPVTTSSEPCAQEISLLFATFICTLMIIKNI